MSRLAYLSGASNTYNPATTNSAVEKLLLDLVLVTETCTHIDPDLCRWPSTKRSEFIRVIEVAVTTTKDIWQPESYATITVDEEDG